MYACVPRSAKSSRYNEAQGLNTSTLHTHTALESSDTPPQASRFIFHHINDHFDKS